MVVGVAVAELVEVGVGVVLVGVGVELLLRKKATTRRTTTKTAIKIFPKLVVWLDMFFSLKIKKSLVRIFSPQIV